MKNGNSLYFDYQASTPVDGRVLAAMEPYWRESFGNPHASNHSIGWAAAKAVEQAQIHVAALLGASAEEIVFTSGATEANNLAILGIAYRAERGKRRRLLVSAIEHKCVLQASRFACKRLGFKLELIPVSDTGNIDIKAVERMLGEDVLLVSVMAANNEIGTLQDLKRLSSLVHSVGAYLHTDAAQAPCAMDLNWVADYADLASLSAHKMYGPQGIGALYVRQDLHQKIEPLIHGGEQQSGMRSGTIPVALVVGMARASEILMSAEAPGERDRVREQRDRFVNGLRQHIPGIQLNGPQLSQRHPGNANIRFPNISAEDLLLALQPGLAASTGSACTSGIPEPSHVLRAIGLEASSAESSVRFGVGRFTDEAMVDTAIELIASTYMNICNSLAVE